MIVDAHIHVWSPDRDRYPYAPGFSPADPWLPSFTPDDHQRWSAAVGEPMRINLIQITWYGLDHSYIIDLIDSDPERYVGTGIIPAVTDAGLGSPDRTMLDLAARGVRAFRIRGRSAQPAFGQRERWLDQEGYERMFATASEHGLVLSFLIGPADLDELDRMCERFPEAPVVIDHVGGVRVRDGVVDAAGLEAVIGLARHPKVYVKLGPIHALSDGPAPFADTLPLLQAVIAAYGADRCMWESDSGGPVLMEDPCRDLAAAVSVIQDADFLTAADKKSILATTAQRLLWP
jgi:predicted TIM-barrel fold metal-dependent hydrolase